MISLKRLRQNLYVHLLSSNTTQSPTDTWKLSDLNEATSGTPIFLNYLKNSNNDILELSVEGYYKNVKHP
jgi:hypothetical protein